MRNRRHLNALSSPAKEMDCEENGCLGSQGWHFIILFLFSTSGVMQLFSGGQLTTNYLLNREVKPMDLNPRLREWRRTGHSLTVHSIPGPTSLLGLPQED